MPQIRKTAARHKLEGTYRASKHQQRPADAGTIGAAPEGLDDDLQAVWDELANALPPGVGCEHDRAAFELAVRMVAKMRAGKLSAAEATLLHNILAGFGLTPVGRQRLDTKPTPPPTELDDRLNPKKLAYYRIDHKEREKLRAQLDGAE